MNEIQWVWGGTWESDDHTLSNIVISPATKRVAPIPPALLSPGNLLELQVLVTTQIH